MSDFIISAFHILIAIVVIIFALIFIYALYLENKYWDDPEGWERFKADIPYKKKKLARESASSVLPGIAEELRKESGFPTEKAIFVAGPAHSCSEVASSKRHEDVKLTITLSSSPDESSGSQSAPPQTPRE